MLKFAFVAWLTVASIPAFGQAYTPPVNTNVAKTVSILPTCNAASTGTRLYVTDALLPAALATVAAGGSVVVPVFCNGVNWIVM